MAEKLDLDALAIAMYGAAMRYKKGEAVDFQHEAREFLLESASQPGSGEDDTARIDWLEREINEHGAIHLHDGRKPHGHGLGLRPGMMVRTLREAIDQARAAQSAGNGEAKGER